ncbi:helix-turn-helix transcriptional regulator [Oscillatoria laete-virens NRMC-F 0139]|nr:helix-turn-helix transcriptional regulator [Oscillatoria laete-virens]MDL5053625.1 helix-turn-helix transcriptional regulator [Oscillatoria laete-virens NRMC-F 0139]
MSKKTNKHRGGRFEDFLKEEGLYDEIEQVAEKRALALQLQKAMKEEDITKAELARRMHTSRAVVDRLLDPENKSVTLISLHKAASVLQRRWHFELIPA